MAEQGMIILEDGTKLSFGTYYCPDDPMYFTTPTHEKSFNNEIVPSFEFRSSDHIYNEDLSLYHNALQFSLDGMIVILNNQASTQAPTSVLAYVPMVPTEEQLNALKENETLQNIEIQNVHAFQSYDFDDTVDYDSFENYINSNTNIKD